MMHYKAKLISLLGILATMSSSNALSQSLCGVGAVVPPAGQLCILVSSSDAAATQSIIGASPQTFTSTIGDYMVMMTATYVVAAGGIEVNLAGTATRIADSGNAMANIIVRVEGGRSSPLGVGNGALNLSGSSTGVGQVIQGGAAGYSVLGGQDLQFDGFNQVLTANLFGPGDFALSDPQTEIVEEGAIAVQGITTFQLNQVGDTIDIPSGTGAGDVFPADTGRAITLRAPPDGNEDGIETTDLDRLEHWPVERFRVVIGSECDVEEHWHAQPPFSQPGSLEGSAFTDNDNCGLGKVGNTGLQTLALVEKAISLDGDFNIPAGEAMFVTESGSLTVPEGVTLTVNREASLAIQGVLVVAGRLVIGEGSRVDVDGFISNSSYLDIAGTLNNWGAGSINNTGVITNLVSGTIQNMGKVGNPGELCNDGLLLNKGTITDNAPAMVCDLFFGTSFD